MILRKAAVDIGQTGKMAEGGKEENWKGKERRKAERGFRPKGQSVKREMKERG